MAYNLDDILSNIDKNIERKDKERSVEDLKKSILDDALANMDRNINRIQKENDGFNYGR